MGFFFFIPLSDKFKKKRTVLAYLSHLSKTHKECKIVLSQFVK